MTEGRAPIRVEIDAAKIIESVTTSGLPPAMAFYAERKLVPIGGELGWRSPV